MALFDWLGKKKAPPQPVAPVRKPVAAVAAKQPRIPSVPEPAPKHEPAVIATAKIIKDPTPAPMPTQPMASIPPPAPAQSLPPITPSPPPPPPPQPMPPPPPAAAADTIPAPESVPDKQTLLARDRSLYKTILGALYDAVLILDPKGYVIGSNKRTEIVFGRPEHDLWDTACTKLITGLNPMVLAKIRENVANGRFMVITTQCIRLDGTLVPTEIAFSRITYMNDFDLLLSIRNNEQRELENEALRRTYAGLMVCNYEGMIEYVNPTLLRMLNYNLNHEMQKHFLGDFCASLQSAEMLLRAPTESTSWIGHLTMLAAKGRQVEVMASSTCCPQRPDGQQRVVITLMPANQAQIPVHE